METWILTVKSYTEAIKGKRFLQELNIKSEVQKISGGSGGCAYAIRIGTDPHKATRLLGTVGINVKTVKKGRSDGHG